MITPWKPEIKDLWFRQALLADPETMAYNRAWGGTIPFPEEKWEKWYQAWLTAPEFQRYYRYLLDTDAHRFVGEIAYRLDGERNVHLCSVIVLAGCRRRGFGSAGIRLLCGAAKANGVPALYADIAADNPSRFLFLKHGFEPIGQSGDAITVKKEL